VVDETRLKELIALAQAVSTRAYCPYSKFPVGAVVISASGTAYAGCNVENAAYGETICAERSAIVQMVAAGEQDFKIIVIYTPTQVASASCGSCRQVMNEFSPNARIISVCDTDDRIDTRVSEFLPAAFGPRNLA